MFKRKKDGPQYTKEESKDRGFTPWVPFTGDDLDVLKVEAMINYMVFEAVVDNKEKQK